MHTAVCGYVYCGQEFTAQRSTAQYCSRDCRVAAFHYRERVAAADVKIDDDDRPCADFDCDQLVEWWARRDKIFCSNACKQRYYRNYGGPPLRLGDLATISALRVQTSAK
jgi:hypothetical protein